MKTVIMIGIKYYKIANVKYFLRITEKGVLVFFFFYFLH